MKASMDIIGLIIAMSTSIVSALIFYIQNKFDTKNAKNENEAVEKVFEKLKKLSDGKNLNVIKLTLKNVAELREYYIISLNQARRSFSAALVISIFGFMLYTTGIIVVTLFNRNALIISLISGTVAEIIAGLFFWLHSQSIKQLNLYHQRLGYSEKYLMVLQLIDTMSEDRKYGEYRNVINYILNDNQAIIKQSSDKDHSK